MSDATGDPVRGDREAGEAGGPPAAIGWVILGALVSYAFLIHHGVGPPKHQMSPPWYDPRGFLFESSWIAPLLDGFPRALLALGAPAVVLAIGVFLGTRSAVARALAVTSVLAVALFLFYGVAASRVWAFFGWRGSAVLALTALCVGLAATAPLLATSWLRLSWPLRLAVYLPVVFTVVAFLRNATGTDPSLAFNISPWPAVPVFGMEVGALVVAIVLLGMALGFQVIARAPAREPRATSPAALAAGILLAIAVPAILLWAGNALGAFPFRARPGMMIFAGVVSAMAVGLTVLATRRRNALPVRVRAHRFLVGAALLGIPLVAGEALARWDYYVTRDFRAREIIDALQQYLDRESVYPDELETLVEEGLIDAIPEPDIGFGFLYDGTFTYQNFGTSFILEFPAPRWVECAYTPPYEGDEEYEEEEAEEDLEPWETPGDAADDSLGEAWSCPSRPPELW